MQLLSNANCIAKLGAALEPSSQPQDLDKATLAQLSDAQHLCSRKTPTLQIYGTMSGIHYTLQAVVQATSLHVHSTLSKQARHAYCSCLEWPCQLLALPSSCTVVTHTVRHVCMLVPTAQKALYKCNKSVYESHHSRPHRRQRPYSLHSTPLGLSGLDHHDLMYTHMQAL